MFKTVKNPPDFPALDRELLNFWEEKKIFERSISEREGGEDYVFYDGPPGTNGVPHVGHIMQSSLKDLWPRFWTMRGKRVLRKAGWDTHGLPVELTADRQLGLESKRDIEKFGIQEYVDHCRSIVFQFRGKWEEAIHRCGRFVDLKDFYATYKTSYIQSDWWVLKQAFETKVKPEFVNPANLLGNDRFLYKDYRISAWCPRQGTTLSNFEVAQGYQEITELALFPKFRIKGEANTYLAAWTTTAWTLLSNVAIAVGPDITYLKLRIKETTKAAQADDRIFVAKDRLSDLERFLGEYEVESSLSGKDLAGIEYEPLWDWQNEWPGDAKRHFVIADTYVTTEDGTGMVHLAPYGEDDYRLMKVNQIPAVLMVNEHGYVEENAGSFSGHWFKDEDLELNILKDLAARNLLLGKEKHEHTYPFHYKTGSPLMYFPRPGWFLRSTAMREELLEANEHINWYPNHIKHGRFGKWLENIQDWNITRERFWGSPLPIWTANNEQAVCVASLAELNEQLVNNGQDPLPEDFDPHKPGIDNVVLQGNNGDELHRENFVLDSWFNAGIMPWGQIGYPADEGSVDYFNNQYPCDFICEGLDQTRGWFYSLLAVSTLLAIARKDEDSTRWSSYRNVICTDLVLDEDGEKMSKSKGNVVPPVPIMEKYGADTVRWSFYKNTPWLPVRFGEDGLRESMRQVFMPLWNAYSFFVTYANIDDWRPGRDLEMAEPTPLDRWILTCFVDMQEEIQSKLEQYDVMPAAASVTDFVDRLTNWYIRRSRRRFWKSEEPLDKNRAYHTLYQVLTGLSRVLAPFAPFLTEEIYLNLVAGQIEGAKDSVHLEDWPGIDETLRDDELKANMDLARKIVSSGHSARNDGKLKVRQPLRRMYVAGPKGADEMVRNLMDLVHDELNIKEVDFIQDSEKLFTFSAKANFKALGPRFGKEVKTWAAKISEVDSETALRWKHDETVTIDGEEFTSEEVLLHKEMKENLLVKEENELTIALDTFIDDELRDEGYARELINKIQNKRKELDFEVVQRIHVHVECDDRLVKALEKHSELISREVLALSFETSVDNHHERSTRINDRVIWFDIKAD